jgi:hypothetical protein
MAVARNAKRAFSPLDEELGLIAGDLTPKGHENLVQLGARMPFEQSCKVYEALLGMGVSTSTARRCTERAGRAYEEIQEEEMKRLQSGMAEVSECQAEIQVSADGAMVPLLQGVWAEVKTVVVGEIERSENPKGERVVRTKNISYFSRKADAERFSDLAIVELHRRKVETASQVVAIMDGAEWEQGFIDYHCPKATRILDFAHAAQHVNAVGEAIYGENTEMKSAWLNAQLYQLKQEGAVPVLAQLQKVKEHNPNSEEITKNIAYLEKRKEQMRYAEFQKQGWPIGSGAVESANKIVVESRLKGAGMRWQADNVNPMLCLRNVICSNRWDEAWIQIENKICMQSKQKRVARRTQQAKEEQLCQVESGNPNEPKPTAPVITQDKQSPSHDELPTTPKKNPWRNFKHGKAQFQPSHSPKN